MNLGGILKSLELFVQLICCATASKTYIWDTLGQKQHKLFSSLNQLHFYYQLANLSQFTSLVLHHSPDRHLVPTRAIQKKSLQGCLWGWFCSFEFGGPHLMKVENWLSNCYLHCLRKDWLREKRDSEVRFLDWGAADSDLDETATNSLKVG